MLEMLLIVAVIIALCNSVCLTALTLSLVLHKGKKGATPQISNTEVYKEKKEKLEFQNMLSYDGTPQLPIDAP